MAEIGGGIPDLAQFLRRNYSITAAFRIGTLHTVHGVGLSVPTLNGVIEHSSKMGVDTVRLCRRAVICNLVQKLMDIGTGDAVYGPVSELGQDVYVYC